MTAEGLEPRCSGQNRAAVKSALSHGNDKISAKAFKSAPRPSGVPAYLSWFEAEASLTENIRKQILAPGSLALGEVELLLYDDVREPRTYLNILQAIGNGAHALADIANATMIASTNLTTYLLQLQELRLVERRLPATVPPHLRQRSKQGRYHLTDPFHRFYFRFLQPNQAELSYQPDRVLPLIQPHNPSRLRNPMPLSRTSSISRKPIRRKHRASHLNPRRRVQQANRQRLRH